VKGFSTKYALSQGIQAVEVEDVKSGKYVYTTDQYMTQLVPGKTFFVSQDDAEREARRNAEAKIYSLEKQIEKLRVLAVTPKFAK
jgi:hypothetical protein